MQGVDRTLGLIGRIYDAAVDRDRWGDFLETLAGSMRASSALLCFLDRASSRVVFAASAGIGADWMRKYDAHFATVDVWKAALDELPAGRAYRSETFLPVESLVESDFFRGFLRPLNIFHACGGFTLKEGPFAALVAVHRGRDAGPFKAGDERFLSVLLPHLGRAVRLHGALDWARARERAVREALGRLPIGVAIVDQGGRVVVLNRVAGEIVGRSDGMSIQDGYLCAAFLSESRDLRNLIQRACAHGTGDERARGGAMRITRPSLLRPLQILAVPLGEHADEQGSVDTGGGLAHVEPAAIVFMGDPDRAHGMVPEVLAELFGLTAVEARLVAALIEGKSLLEIAKAFGVSRETVRSQLKRVFEKTETTRQAELIHFVLSGPAPIAELP